MSGKPEESRRNTEDGVPRARLAARGTQRHPWRSVWDRCVEHSRDAALRVALRAAVPCSVLRGPRVVGKVGILMYHRVTERCHGVPAPTWNVTPQRFRAQLRGLLRRGFRAWPLRQVIAYGHRQTPIPPRTFVVTFDDGYESVYASAWPVLKELDVPATVFLATAFLDSDRSFPFDDWLAKGSPRVPAQAWRPLSTAQCREMAATGLVELGAHTHTHDDFRTRPAAFEQDLARCVTVMRERFELSVPTFAFPFGFRGARDPVRVLTPVAKGIGVACGLTTEPVLVDPTSDPFEWGRFCVSDADSASMIAAFLDGWYDTTKRALRRVWRVSPGPTGEASGAP